MPLIISGGGGGGGSGTSAVDSVNTKTGIVVINPDDLVDTATTNKFVTAADKTLLGNTSGENTGDDGTVTSVAVTGSDGIEVDSGTPITSSGTIALGVNKATMLSTLNVEDGADVTDATNVRAAGALMDDEVDADIKTLLLPASTTISTFGASIIDDANAADARTTLGVDEAGTDNSTDVTVTDTSEIDLTLTGQEISADIKALSIDETKLDTSVNASLDLADSAIQSGDNISELNNDSGYTTNAGTVTSVAGGTGLTSTEGTTPSISHDSHTGDATGSTALTLATVNSNVGAFTNASVTVNGKGLVTAASTGIVTTIKDDETTPETFVARSGNILITDATVAADGESAPSWSASGDIILIY